MERETTAIDLTPTHTVRRVSTTPAEPLRVFFNALGRSLMFNPANAELEPGSPQDVPACVVEALAEDPKLAEHFAAAAIDADTPATAERADAVRARKR